MAQTDKWRKAKSLFATTLTTGIGTGTGDTITLNSTTGLPTDTEITLTFNRVDSDGVVQDTADVERITGTISGSTLTSYTRGVDGTTEQAHGGGTVVEYIWNADDWNDAVDSFLAEHNQAGTHQDITANSLNIGSSTTISGVLDEDDMASDSATSLATQQSIKAYVDNSTTTDGWTSYTAVTPTSGTLDDPTFELTFAGVDLTSTLSAGMRLKITQSTVKYFIITKVAFSTDTTVTVYGGTDYDLVDTGTTAITAVSYSTHKAPVGFPLDVTKWTVSTEVTSSGMQSSPTTSTWYNLGTVSLEIPIGIWGVEFQGSYSFYKDGTEQWLKGEATLSTANNSESDATFTSTFSGKSLQGGSNGGAAEGTFYKKDILSITSKTTYYANYQYLNTNITSISNNASHSPLVIRAVCAYL